MHGAGTIRIIGVSLAVFLLLKLLKPAVYLYALLKVQYRYPKYSVTPPEEVPVDLREYLLQGAEPVFALGFSMFAWLRHTPMEYSEFGDSYVLALIREPDGLLAYLNVTSTATGLRANFGAEFAGGPTLETYHGESKALIGEFANKEIIDTNQPDVVALWQCFQARFVQLAAQYSVVRRDPEARAASIEASLARTIDTWVASGTLQPAREAGRFELTWPQAWRLSRRLGDALAKNVAFRKARAAYEPKVLPLSEQIGAYRKVRESAERRSSRFGVGWVLIVSGILFMLSMLRLFDWRDVPGLIAVLMFHELGHYGAMRVFGYRDTSIFFIPFLGAAARGVKHDERIHEQLGVLLAGPAPGIVLGVALAKLFPAMLLQPQLRFGVEMLIWLNLFNLLPIFPLDGGRIFQLIFSSINPFIEVAIRALGAAALLGLGIFASDPVTIALAVLLAIGIPAARRTAAAVQRIRAQGPVPAQEEARLALLFTELRTNQPSLPPAKSYGVVLPLARRLRDGQLGALGATGWCGAYLGFVFAGCVGFFLVVTGGVARGSYRMHHTPLACGEIENLRDTLAPARGSFSFRCELSDKQRVASVIDAVHEYAWFPSHECLRAPWDAKTSRTPQQLAAESRARHTIIALERERMRLGDHDQDADENAVDSAADKNSAAEQQHEAAIKTALQAYVQAHATDASFDAEAATLYVRLDRAAFSRGAAETPDLRALLDKLGRTDRACGPGVEATYALAEEKGVTVGGLRSDVRAGARDMAQYLCATGCALTYGVRMSPSTARAARESSSALRSAKAER